MSGISHKQAIQWIHRRMDGLLNDDQLLELEDHLQSCEFCRTYAAELDALPAELQSKFHVRWDKESGPSQKVMTHVTRNARKIPMSNRISSGATLLAGTMALILLAVAINFAISRLQSTSSATNPTEIPSPRADDRLLAFVSDQSGNFDIFTVRADGSGLTNLTNHPGNDSHPVWSPDGKRIAFESDRDGFRQIYLMDADGANLTRLTKEEADHSLPEVYDGRYNPWSPDGSRLVFVQEDPGGEPATLYSVEVNGENEIKLADGKIWFSGISWSPDGSQVAYVLNGSPTPREAYVPDIYIVDSDGNNLRELKSFLPEGETLAFTPYYWSSNRQSIVFTSYTVTGGPLRQTLYEFDVITNTFSNRTDIRPDVIEWRDGIALRSEVNQYGTPYVWERPDGTTHTFEESGTWGESCSEDLTRSPQNNFAIGGYCPTTKFNLYWTNADGSTIKHLLTVPIHLSMGGVGDITWSPDEQYLAFNLTTDEKTEMYVVKVEEALANPATEPLRLHVSNDREYHVLSWQPIIEENLAKENPTPQPEPTPNSLLAFTSDQYGNYDIFTMHADGTGLINLTNHPARDTNPIWSPDGKHIAFESDRDGFTQIYIMDANGSNVTQLTNDEEHHKLPLNHKGTHNPWSPDSRRLIFIQEESDGGMETLYSIDINGDNKITLANSSINGRFSLGAISWAPGGKHIGYVINISAEQKDTFIPNTYVVEPDGSNARELKNFLPAGKQFDLIYAYYWSSNGQSIVFPALGSDPLQEILYELDLQTNSFLRETETKPVIEDWTDEVSLIRDIYQEGTPYVWVRPDGTSNTFESSKTWDNTFDPATASGPRCSLNITRSTHSNFAFGIYCPDSKFNLYRTNSDGSTIQTLLTLSIDVEPDGVGNIAWSPDDRYIAFNLASANKTDMYIVEVEEFLANSSLQPLQVPVSAGEGGSIPSWQPITEENLAKENPTPQPNFAFDGLLAFTSDQNGNYDIYTMQADGSELTNITNHPAGDSSPFWSPDGQRIAFISGRSGSVQIHLMDADGSNVTQLTNGEGDYRFDINGPTPWSPDGRKLIFSHKAPEEQKGSKLYVIDIYEKTITTLTDEPGGYLLPSWSPNGNHIAFSQFTDGAPVDLLMVGSDGTRLVELTKNVPSGEFVPLDYYWSQDGESLIFITGGGTYSTVYSASSDGSLRVIQEAEGNEHIQGWWNGTTLLIKPGDFLAWLRADGSEATLDLCQKASQLVGIAHKWSDRGNLFLASKCTGGEWMFHWANPDGTMIDPLLDSPLSLEEDTLFNPTWSMDEKYVSFMDNKTLYILDIAKAREDPSIQPLIMANSVGPSWQPRITEHVVTEIPTPQPTLTPSTAGMLAFTSDQSGNHDIYTILADGNGLTNLTDHPARDANPIWSPDGQKIAFESDRDGFMQLYLMNADGSNVIQLTDDEAFHYLPMNIHGVSNPWSPDGSKLLFIKQEPLAQTSTLYSLDIQTGNTVALADGSVLFNNIAWSPDGKYVGYVLNISPTPETTFVIGIHVVDAAGENPIAIHELVPQPETIDSPSFYWSRDKNSIIFLAYKHIDEGRDQWIAYEASPESNQLIERAHSSTPMVDWWEGTSFIRGTDLSTLTWLRSDGTFDTFKPLEICELTGKVSYGFSTKRSSHGSQVINIDCPTNEKWLYYANSDGTIIKPLLDSPIPASTVDTLDTTIAWSSDDQFIAVAVVSRDESRLFLLNINDPATQPREIVISDGELYSVPSWQPIP